MQYKEIDSSSIEYLKFLAENFQYEIDLNMSFLNCAYTKTVQLLAKHFLTTDFNLNKIIPQDLYDAMVLMSEYFLLSFNEIFKDRYERTYQSYLAFTNKETAGKYLQQFKNRDYEELVIQHNHLKGAKNASI